ncbi:MAG: PspC domain-containing protein [Pseudomonadota bacterium]|nr:PspC domain-containing protein [Pseudomonadota bacterium]
MTTRYALDKSNGKLLGVCAGLARTTGWDPTLVRLGALLLTLFALGPVAILLYLVTAFVAEAR